MKVEHKKRHLEKWEDIVRELKLDLSKPVNKITARQIKQISNVEARIMAKIDREEARPRIFKENDSFILPINRQEYMILKGNGYHRIEPMVGPLTKFSTQLPFPISALGVESESAFLDYANSCGLLRELTSTSNLVPQSSDRN